ncbi:MAG: hypothetical protein KJZ93_05375 [Caldilineaceae bacterium]|nr:hypothetical protein [Caldilineaceae bacterium]
MLHRNQNDAVTHEEPSSPPDPTQPHDLGRRPLNRRRLLGGLAGGAAALIAAACGRNRTPTPTPIAPGTATPVAQSSLLVTPSGASRMHLPLVQNGPEVAAAAPTMTPTPPKPTPTPHPTDTPTPVATPFPPGPPSKLGFVVAHNHPQMFELLATGGVAIVSTLEHDATFLADIKRISPRTLLIGRIILPQLELATLDPIATARHFVETVLPLADDDARRPYYDAWQSYNEPVAANADEMKRLGEMEAECTRLLAERGIRSCIGNFGTGQPPLELWEHFLPAVQAAKAHGGWLGLHEYSAPTIYFMSTRENQGRYPGVSPSDTGWLTLRYRQVYDQILKPAGLAIPLVFTEIGVDGYVQNDRPGPLDGRGWQDFQHYWAEHGYGLWGPGAYVEQLVWYDEAMRQDEYVLGGCIFALAASAGWESYDIQGAAAAVLQQYLSVHAPAG